MCRGIMIELATITPPPNYHSIEDNDGSDRHIPLCRGGARFLDCVAHPMFIIHRHKKQTKFGWYRQGSNL